MKSILFILVATAFSMLVSVLTYADPLTGITGQLSLVGIGYGGDVGDGGSSCAPEQKNRNIDIVDASLIKLANSADFKNEALFQSFVAETVNLPSVDAQISAYGSILGLNRKGEPVPRQALLEFLGARDYSKYVQAAQKNLQLRPEAASALTKTIANDLLTGANN